MKRYLKLLFASAVILIVGFLFSEQDGVAPQTVYADTPGLPWGLGDSGYDAGCYDSTPSPSDGGGAGDSAGDSGGCCY